MRERGGREGGGKGAGRTAEAKAGGARERRPGRVREGTAEKRPLRKGAGAMVTRFPHAAESGSGSRYIRRAGSVYRIRHPADAAGAFGHYRTLPQSSGAVGKVGYDSAGAPVHGFARKADRGLASSGKNRPYFAAAAQNAALLAVEQRDGFLAEKEFLFHGTRY